MYQETINSLKKTQTVTAHIKSLGNILNLTEDPQLIKLIGIVYGSLQEAHLKQKGGKSTPLNLYSKPHSTVSALISYCNQFIQTNTPEWKVIALKNGWTPPTSS